jgi:RNA polymerase-interacting CarD/CdnL/TRCF family regulator
MTKIIHRYSIGDWVVHHAYGIGQIKQIDEKRFNEELTACFQVKSKDGANWWFPKNSADNPRIRPIASQEIFQLAQKELQKTVQDVEQDRDKLQIRIEEVRANDALVATSQLVRDLTILQTQLSLNQNEKTALSHFTDRLAREWAATMNMDVDTTQHKLNDLLQTHRERARVNPGNDENK